VPKGLDPAVAAALPTAGVTALEIVESLEPLVGKIVLIVGAAGGVGSFATQLAANAGAHTSWPISPADARQLSRSNMMALGVGQSFHQGAQMPFKLPPAGKRCGVYRLPRLRHACSEDRLIAALSV